jgi:hypothetical protein
MKQLILLVLVLLLAITLPVDGRPNVYQQSADQQDSGTETPAPAADEPEDQPEGREVIREVIKEIPAPSAIETGNTVVTAKNTAFDQASLATIGSLPGNTQVLLENCTVKNSGIGTGPEGSQNAVSAAPGRSQSSGNYQDISGKVKGLRPGESLCSEELFRSPLETRTQIGPTEIVYQCEGISATFRLESGIWIKQ